MLFHLHPCSATENANVLNQPNTCYVRVMLLLICMYIAFCTHTYVHIHMDIVRMDMSMSPSPAQGSSEEATRRVEDLFI